MRRLIALTSLFAIMAGAAYCAKLQWELLPVRAAANASASLLHNT